MRSRMSSLLGTVAAGMMVASLAVSPASATLVNFTIKDGGTDVATGFVDYSSGGTITSFSGLDNFSITILGSATFDYSYVTGAAYQFMQFDTGLNQFVHGPAGDFFGLDLLLGATDAGYAGFTFVYDQGGVRDFSVNSLNEYHHPWTDITYSVETAQVPEPGSLALLGAGLLALAAVRRYRLRPVKVKARA